MAGRAKVTEVIGSLPGTLFARTALALIVLASGCAGPGEFHRREHDRLILVLPGLGGDGAMRANVLEAFTGRGFDVFLPEVSFGAGLSHGVDELSAVLDGIDIDHYREVHAFTFILGGWALNLLLQRREIPNLKSVVYDRSPLQEQAPALLTREMPLLMWMFRGRSVASLAAQPYPPMRRGDVRVGLLIEDRATRLIRTYRDQALPLEAVSFNPESFGQRFDDAMYVPLDHLGMYEQPEDYRDEVLHFFATGRFPPTAPRQRTITEPYGK